MKAPEIKVEVKKEIIKNEIIEKEFKPETQKQKSEK
jgi:hypothetical protein